MEIPNNVDELIDGLPQHIQGKVLLAYEEDPQARNPLKAKEKVGYTVAGLAATAVAVPSVVVGGFLCMTILLIPVGVLIMYLGCYPLMMVVAHLIGRKERASENVRESQTEETEFTLTDEDLLL